jgi:hypothetical protein
MNLFVYTVMAMFAQVFGHGPIDNYADEAELILCVVPAGDGVL